MAIFKNRTGFINSGSYYLKFNDCMYVRNLFFNLLIMIISYEYSPERIYSYNFYINEVETIIISGAAILDFTQFRAEAVFETFFMEIEIAPLGEREEAKGVGCLQMLFGGMLRLFD